MDGMKFSSNELSLSPDDLKEGGSHQFPSEKLKGELRAVIDTIDYWVCKIESDENSDGK